MRVIKKYPNRRLYDATASRYVTLDDIRQLVLDEIPFLIVDRRTDANITRPILLQVIADQEQRGPVLLNESFLSQLIRAHRGSTAPLAADFLDRSLAQFLRPRGDVGGVKGNDPIGA